MLWPLTAIAADKKNIFVIKVLIVMPKISVVAASDKWLLKQWPREVEFVSDPRVGKDT